MFRLKLTHQHQQTVIKVQETQMMTHQRALGMSFLYMYWQDTPPHSEQCSKVSSISFHQESSLDMTQLGAKQPHFLGPTYIEPGCKFLSPTATVATGSRMVVMILFLLYLPFQNSDLAYVWISLLIIDLQNASLCMVLACSPVVLEVLQTSIP